MHDKEKAYKKNLGHKWVKTESGNTYLCPIGALDGISNPSEKHLRELCVEESSNPQNE